MGSSSKCLYSIMFFLATFFVTYAVIPILFPHVQGTPQQLIVSFLLSMPFLLMTFCFISNIRKDALTKK